MAKSPSYEKDYQAQDDARHLMHAQEVMSDKKRHSAAKKHLDKMHKERAKESMHAKAAKGLKRAFPSDSASGGTTVTKINRVPNLKNASGMTGGECC